MNSQTNFIRAIHNKQTYRFSQLYLNRVIITQIWVQEERRHQIFSVDSPISTRLRGALLFSPCSREEPTTLTEHTVSKILAQNKILISLILTQL